MITSAKKTQTSNISSQENNKTKIAKIKQIVFSKVFLIVSAVVIISIVYVGFLLLHKSSPALRIAVKPVSAVPYMTILSTTPQDISQNNADNTKITLSFSQPVKPGSLHSFFTVNPMIPGTFTQGNTPNNVVFTPNVPFADNTAVKVILNHGFEALSGAKFLNDYTFTFYTTTKDNTVSFINGGEYSRLSNVTIGKSISFNLQVGSGVANDGTITVYKGDVQSLLKNMTYADKLVNGSTYTESTYLDDPVDIAAFSKVTSSTGISNNGSFIFSEPAGLYYIAAQSNGSVVGGTWVNVTNDGLIVKQDDQQVILAAQDITNGSILSNITATLYNLKDTQHVLQTATFDKTTTIQIPFSPSVDLVVAQDTNGLILAPLSLPQTQADIGVSHDLSQTSKIYLTTDKPTYKVGDVVHYSGIVRIDNDAKYTVPQDGTSVHIWITGADGTTYVVDQTLQTQSGGVISGQFSIPASLGPINNAQNNSITLYAQFSSEHSFYNTARSFTSFDVINTTDPNLLQVSFDKTSYTHDQPVIAHITGVDGNNKPLANQQITYTVYTKDYDETDATSQTSIGTDWGNPGPTATDIPLRLDANGKANLPITLYPLESSQALTLVVKATVGGQDSYGAKTVLIHQGNAILHFVTSKQTYNSGDTVIARYYARDLQGNPIANSQVQYEIYKSIYSSAYNTYIESTVYQGTSTTNANGFGLIQQQVTTDQNYLTIRIYVIDAAGNKIQAQEVINIYPQGIVPSSLYYHNPQLTNFDIAEDKETYSVGDTANLTITSSFNQNIFVTYESGRIYHKEWLALQKGDNNYTIAITADLAPSFNLLFNYFNNGSFVIEGTSFVINNPSKAITVQTSFDKQSYTPTDTPILTITTTDQAGKPVAANISLDVLDNTIFNLRDVLPQVSPSQYFYNPRGISTNTTSSTLGIGTGGGCGGGSGYDVGYVPNRLGNNMYWDPTLKTNANGILQIPLPASQSAGTFRIYSTIFTDDSAFAQNQTLYSSN